MSSPQSIGKTILELVLGGRHVPPAPDKADRPYLLLEDLLDDPIELTLSDFSPLEPTGAAPRLH